MEPPASPHSETAQQLEQLRLRVADGNPQLYRHWALYLQVLREGLTAAVDQACFHLAVEVHPQRYRRLEPARRLELHRRIAALVRRSCTLLTVEQLQALADQLQRRRRRELLRARRRWLAALQNGQTAEEPTASPGPNAAAEVPQGSVHLGLALPISAHLFGMDQAEPAGGPLPTPDAHPDAGDGSADQRLSAPDSAASDAAAQDLMAVFAGLLDETEADEAVAARPDAGGSASTAGLLPTDPVALLAWLDGLEAALARRLRHLSHALNVELVRLGLSTALLPLRLLEAVAAGQLESQSAPANLVRLAIPVPESSGGTLIETRALLLRPSDLEAEQLRLRTCRTRLQQAREELRRMAQTYQRLEQRLQAHEAQQLWLNDHSTAQTLRTPHPS